MGIHRRAAITAGLLLAGAQAYAGGWTLPAGRTSAKVAFMRHATDERYFLDGERIPYFFDGRSRSRAVFLDLRRGLPRGFEVSVGGALYDLRFDDLSDRRRSTGLGDMRVGLRRQLLRGATVLAVGGEVKLPTGRFDNDAEVVPVGEGQWDFETAVEVGHSFWPRRAYLTGAVGWRWRTRNQRSGIDFGDELFWSAEAGHRLVGSLNARLSARGLHGRSGTSFGFEVPTLRREVIYLQPGLSWEVRPGTGMDLFLPLTLRGRNWPAGVAAGVSIWRKF